MLNGLQLRKKSNQYAKFTNEDKGWRAVRYDTRCYFNVRSKADISQLNLRKVEQTCEPTPNVITFIGKNGEETEI